MRRSGVSALIAGMSGVALAADSATESTGGNELVSPTTMIVKNIPMERIKPEFIRVDIIAEATPRRLPG
jgi:hypothetical protein